MRIVDLLQEQHNRHPITLTIMPALQAAVTAAGILMATFTETPQSANGPLSETLSALLSITSAFPSSCKPAQHLQAVIKDFTLRRVPHYLSI